MVLPASRTPSREVSPGKAESREDSWLGTRLRSRPLGLAFGRGRERRREEAGSAVHERRPRPGVPAAGADGRAVRAGRRGRLRRRARGGGKDADGGLLEEGGRARTRAVARAGGTSGAAAPRAGGSAIELVRATAPRHKPAAHRRARGQAARPGEADGRAAGRARGPGAEGGRPSGLAALTRRPGPGGPPCYPPRPMVEIPVELGERRYSITIGQGAARALPDLLSLRRGRTVAAVASRRVWTRHRLSLEKPLRALGAGGPLILPDGQPRQSAAPPPR